MPKAKYCYVFIIAFKIEVRLNIPQGILYLLVQKNRWKKNVVCMHELM